MWVLITSFKLFCFYSKVLNKINITFSIFSPISLSLFLRTGEKIHNLLQTKKYHFINSSRSLAGCAWSSFHFERSCQTDYCRVVSGWCEGHPSSFWVTNCTFCVNGKIFIPNHCYPDFCPILIQAIIIIERIASFPVHNFHNSLRSLCRYWRSWTDPDLRADKRQFLNIIIVINHAWKWNLFAN